MNTLRFICRRNIHQIRQIHKCAARHIEATTATTSVDSSADASAAASTATPESQFIPTGQEQETNAKIELIANHIAALNLIEVAQLSELLKKKLNLPDAPMMPMGGFMPAAAKVEEEEAEPEAVQTAFTVKLTAFDEKQKIALIKELKNILPDCNLVQAKKFVESAPAIIKSDIKKEQAEELKTTIEKVGGTIEIV